MSYPIFLPAIGNDLAERIDEELARARAKFPSQDASICYLALAEEVGEVAKAMLENVPPSDVEAELVQVAVMAIRTLYAVRKGVDG